MAAEAENDKRRSTKALQSRIAPVKNTSKARIAIACVDVQAVVRATRDRARASLYL
jgi:hypothetical protein